MVVNWISVYKSIDLTIAVEEAVLLETDMKVEIETDVENP